MANIIKNIKNATAIKKTDAFDLSRIKVARLHHSSALNKELLQDKNIDISRFDKYQSSTFNMLPISYGDDIYYETPLTLPPDVLKNINNYRFIYNKRHKISPGMLKNVDKDDVSYERFLMFVDATASLFNPLYNVQINGFTDNVPLLNDIHDNNALYDDKNLNNCSIKELVRLSHKKDSILGNARYRYADFMYCKDLGKIANNHLITLRKFAWPVGDNIFRTSAGKYAEDTDNPMRFDGYGDVGRLVTWFGTDDNKLEDILKYDYSMSWMPLESKIEEHNSKEDAQQRGTLGMILNTVNPAYNNFMSKGFSGGDNHLFNKLGIKWLGAYRSDNDEMMSIQADKNKIYTPRNTVQDTHLYEGKLKFSQEFTLNFSYKIRAYDNINPKSAMLDLLGNIMEVTYRRGEFWGGARKILGPPPYATGWKKANAFINDSYNTLGGFLTGMASGSVTFADIIGYVSNMADSISNGAQKIAASMIDSARGGAQQVLQDSMDLLKTVNEKTNLSQTIKGQLKNAIGRPALYAFDSLLSGDNVGLWHVTIGNPKNPIMSIGNLIMTGATVQHLGPLGIDDFPTELRVSVKLKHARSRDAVDIERMYTKGESALYLTLRDNYKEDFIPFNATENFNNNYITNYNNAQVDKLSYKQDAEDYAAKSDVINYMSAENNYIDSGLMRDNLRNQWVTKSDTDLINSYNVLVDFAGETNIEKCSKKIEEII